MEYSKKMLAALEDTVFAYEKAIAALEAGKPVRPIAEAFDRYCRLCDATEADFTRSARGYRRCPGCILDGQASAPETMPCLEKTYYARRDAENLSWDLGEAARPDLLKALLARLAWIIKRADKNGIVLVNKKGKP